MVSRWFATLRLEQLSDHAQIASVAPPTALSRQQQTIANLELEIQKDSRVVLYPIRGLVEPGAFDRLKLPHEYQSLIDLGQVKTRAELALIRRP